MDNTTTVQTSTNYNSFKFLNNNRAVVRGHVENLKRAFEETGNLTQVQPLLVNENMEIIDGQHRFSAAKELGQPIYFVVYPGLRVTDARAMNILSRNWSIEDFAHSYASGGDPSYKLYLKLKEDYGTSVSIILQYVNNYSQKGALVAFRRGEFTITQEQYEETRKRLDLWDEVVELMPKVSRDRNLAAAMLRVMNTPGYDHPRMLEKLTQLGEHIPRYATITDYLRALEEVYNYKKSDVNRLRLY